MGDSLPKKKIFFFVRQKDQEVLLLFLAKLNTRVFLFFCFFSETLGRYMRDENSMGRFGRELLIVQDGSLAASAAQPALHRCIVGVGTRDQLLYSRR